MKGKLPYKKSFITKSLRPNVRGQYYNPKQETEKTAGQEQLLNLLKNVDIEGLKNYSTRRKIILDILTHDLNGQAKSVQVYIQIIKEMFPNVVMAIENEKHKEKG
jgi:hypothetical protein